MIAKRIWFLGIGILIIIVGILLTINYWDSKERRKVGETHAKVQNFVEVLLMYSEENKQFPYTGSIQGIISILEPKYFKDYKESIYRMYGEKLPRNIKAFYDKLASVDVWGHELRYIAWPESNPQHFRIGSAGKDGVWSHQDLREYKVRVRARWEKYSYNDDIVISDEGLVQGVDFE